MPTTVFTAKSYTCGPNGRVRRLLDLDPGIPAGTNWTDVNVPDAVTAGATIWDIETAVNDGNHVFAVGDAMNNSGPVPPYYGVAVSVNGGTSWNIPGGNYTNAPFDNLSNGGSFKWNEVVTVGPQVYGVSGVSYIVGTNLISTGVAAIAKSTDGGANYTLIGTPAGSGDWVPLLPGPQQSNTYILDNEAWSVHFEGQVGVIGLHDIIIKTTNGGASWLIMNNGLPLSDSLGNPLSVGNITGIQTTADQTMVTAIGERKVVSTCQTGSANAGEAVNTWNESSAGLPPSGFVGPIGWHISPPPVFNTPLAYAYTFASGDYNLNAIALSGGGCSGWANPLSYYSINGPSRRAQHVFAFNSLAGQYAAIYNQNNQVWITNNVNGVIGFLADQASEGLDYIPTAAYTWYEEHEEPDPQCYILQNCAEPGTQITVSDPAFGPLIGSVVTLNEIPGCWSVISITNNCNGAFPYTINLQFQTCVECLPGPCYLLTDCNDQQITYLTSSNLNFYVLNNLVVNVAEYQGCFTVSEVQDCGSVLPPTVTVTNSFANCDACYPHCYRLVDCLGVEDDIITNTNVSQYIGQVIQIQGSTVCWQVEDNGSNCVGAVSVTVTLFFDTCEACLPVCYLLTDCTNQANTKTVTNDLSIYVGQVIKLDQDNTCWQVSVAPDCDGAETVLLSAVYATCQACLPQPPPLVEVNPRRVKPGYYTAGCSPAYTEKVNCHFAEQLYNHMLSVRYGINVCCDSDMTKWEIKKKLLDMAAIYDPELCKCQFQECCPPTCVTVTVQQFSPRVACIPPEQVTSSIEIPT